MALFLVGDALDTVFGFAALPSKAGHRRFRASALAILACAAVVPLNPYGVAMYSYPLETLRSHAMQSYIGEWLSPNFHQHRYLPTLLMMLATAALPALSPRRLRPREILLLSITTYAALRSVRHIPIYALVAVPILSSLIQACLQERGIAKRFERKQIPLTPAKASANALLLAGFLAFVSARVHYVTHHQADKEAKEFPARAVSFIAAQRPPGPMLNHYNWGGYFIWRLYPEYQVYIDGRADLYGDAFMDDLATAYYLRGDSWRAPFEKWGIRTVVLPPDAPLVTALAAQHDWKTIYADGQAIVLTKTQ
jgi:MFS family permease